jgi:hypothetical protein
MAPAPLLPCCTAWNSREAKLALATDCCKPLLRPSAAVLTVALAAAAALLSEETCVKRELMSMMRCPLVAARRCL